MLLLIGSEKGGTGKSTIATNLAAMLAVGGGDVLLVDTDLQESATIWTTMRVEAGVEPVIACVTKRGKVGSDLLKLKEKFQHVIVDAGGRDSLELRQAMAVCDRMVIPVRPSQFDSWTIDHMAMLIREIEERVGRRPKASIVLNMVSANPQVREAEEVRAVLADHAELIPVMGAQIVDRMSFRRAVREGKGVTELTGSLADQKAAREMTTLYQEIFNVKTRTRTQAPS